MSKEKPPYFKRIEKSGMFTRIWGFYLLVDFQNKIASVMLAQE